MNRIALMSAFSPDLERRGTDTTQVGEEAQDEVCRLIHLIYHTQDPSRWVRNHGNVVIHGTILYQRMRMIGRSATH